MPCTLTLVLTACLVSAVPESECYEPQPGDLILFQSPGVLRNVVYALGCSGGVTHSGIIVKRPDGSLGMLEAPGTGYPVMISDVHSRRANFKGRTWVRRRCIPLTPEQNQCLTDFACRQEGKPFFTLGVLIPPFGKPIPKHFPKCVEPEDLDANRWFCSSLCTAAMIAAGLIDPCDAKPWFVDPQDLKSDRWLDLSCGWHKPFRWLYCGEKQECWFSISCCGKMESWK